jgi:hypothetical protein
MRLRRNQARRAQIEAVAELPSTNFAVAKLVLGIA